MECNRNKKEKNMNIKSNFKSLIILFVLLVFAFMMSFFLNPSSATTVITHYNNNNDLIQWSQEELLKGKEIIGHFKAKENYLGILSFRFNTFERINNDVVIFRVKQNGSKNWYYQNFYKVDQFQPNDFFTFGFPIIDNSEGKIYDFQIVSTAGKKGDAISVSNIEPVFATKYQFPKSLILSNPKFAFSFLVKKIIVSFSDIGFYSAFFVFILPFIFYLIWVIPPKKPDIGKQILFLMIFLEILIEIILPLEFNNWIVLGVLGIWVLLIIFYKLKFTSAFLFSALLLTSVPFIFVSGYELSAEKFAILSYAFLLIGTLHLSINVVKNLNKNEK